MAWQVGCDINVAIDSHWLAAMLPFVAGLGPRKAAKLLQDIRKLGFAASRHSIYRDHNLLGMHVFRYSNCPMQRSRSACTARDVQACTSIFMPWPCFQAPLICHFQHELVK